MSQPGRARGWKGQRLVVTARAGQRLGGPEAGCHSLGQAALLVKCWRRGWEERLGGEAARQTLVVLPC